MVTDGLMTLDEAAAYLGVAKITLRRWTRQGQLPCVRIGKRGDRRFRRADLDSYIDGRKALGPAHTDTGSSPSKKVWAPGRRLRCQ